MPDQIELRPYQSRAAASVLEAWAKHDRVLISQPTGTGKTVMASKLSHLWEDLAEGYDKPSRVLWLAHRDELINQAAQMLLECTGQPVAIEKGEQSVKRSAELFDRRVVVSSIQTMARENRRERFGRNEFGMVVADEAHHAPCESWETVLDYFAAAKLIGMTATTDRTDEVSLGKIFDVVAYHYDILDAITDGWLSPIRQQFIEVEGLDWSGVRVSKDLSAEDISAVIEKEATLHKIVAPIAELAGGRQTILFAPTVATAEAIASLLPRYGKSAASVSGKTPSEERAKIIDDYKYGDFQFLVNCMILTEGFDAPATSCIAICRPTQSRMLYAQMVGRGLRGGPRCPVEGKSDCLVLDLAGASLKHKLISSVGLLGGKYDAIVVEAAYRAVRKKHDDEGTSVDVLQELQAAKLREEELRTEQRRDLIAQAKITRKTIDPFDVLDMPANVEQEPGWLDKIQATEAQVEQLQRSGIKAEGSITQSEAKRLLREVQRRVEEGVCTFKQAKILRARGFDPAMPLQEASDVIDHIASRPDGFKFGREDGIRRNQAKSRGHPFTYDSLRWEYIVRPNTAVQLVAGNAAARPYTTTRQSVFSRVSGRKGDRMIFTVGDKSIIVDRADVAKRIK